jgi:hypothetical protein
MRLSLVAVIVALAVSTAASQEPLPTNAAQIARAKSFELDTPYVPPPGDAMEHHTSGFAKIMCSAVFITGLDPDFAAENVGYFTTLDEADRARVLANGDVRASTRQSGARSRSARSSNRYSTFFRLGL